MNSKRMNPQNKAEMINQRDNDTSFIFGHTHSHSTYVQMAGEHNLSYYSSTTYTKSYASFSTPSIYNRHTVHCFPFMHCTDSNESKKKTKAVFMLPDKVLEKNFLVKKSQIYTNLPCMLYALSLRYDKKWKQICLKSS